MNTPPGPDSESQPPAIPSARSDLAGHPEEGLLIWVRTGVAHIRTDSEDEFRLSDGEGVWIPADHGTLSSIVTEPGTVAFPLTPRVSAATGAPTAPTPFDVPKSWQDWLIQHFNLMVTPLGGDGYSQDGWLELLRRRDSRRSVSPRGEEERPSALEPLTVPRSSGAKAVAEALLRDPALDLTVADWAARVVSGERTLRRDFVSQTGLTFEQWRLHCRLSAAIEFLAAGYGVEEVAARVGFASRNGFSRAFKQQFGSTPREFSWAVSARDFVVDPSQRVTAARQADDLAQRVKEGRVSAAAPDLLPAARTASHSNADHVLSWVYRGSGYLDIRDRRYERGRGVATWIPAGVEHVTGLRRDSISLPLGDISGSELRLTEPLQVQFSAAWDDYLMFCAISARSRLRPDGFERTHILDLFREQLAAQRARSAPLPAGEGAQAAAMNFLRTIGTSEESAAHDLPPEVHRAFREEMGMTFASWRYAARMRIASEMLVSGAKPSAVARRVGYAHLPNFSSAFSRFHGVSPREYQERQAGGF